MYNCPMGVIMPGWEIAVISICSILGLFIVAYLFIGLYFVLKFFKRKDTPLIGATEGISEQRKNLVNPTRMEALKKIESVPYEDIKIKSDDGLILAGRIYKTTKEKSKGLIICMHGFHSNPLRVYAFINPYFLEDGWDTLLISARAHADSEGKWCGFSMLEYEDVRAWLVPMLDRYDTIYLYGQSMGAATMGLVSGTTLPPQIKGIIWDCGFSSPKKEFFFNVKKNLRPLAAPMFIAASLFTKILFGFNFFSKKYEAKEQIKKATIPFIFFHGTNDEVVPCEMVYDMDKACPTEHSVHIFEGAEHMASIYIDPERYIGLVKEFINKYK